MENLVICTLASYKGNLRLCSVTLVRRIIKKSNDRKYLYFHHVCLVYGGRKKGRRIESKLLLYLIIL